MNLLRWHLFEEFSKIFIFVPISFHLPHHSLYSFHITSHPSSTPRATYELRHRSYLINRYSKSYATPLIPPVTPRNETRAEIPPITNNPTDRSRARVFTIQRSAVTWDATWLLYSIRVKRNVDGSRLGWDNKKWRSGRRTRHLIVRGTVVVVARTRSP